MIFWFLNIFLPTYDKFPSFFFLLQCKHLQFMYIADWTFQSLPFPNSLFFIFLFFFSSFFFLLVYLVVFITIFLFTVMILGVNFELSPLIRISICCPSPLFYFFNYIYKFAIHMLLSWLMFSLTLLEYVFLLNLTLQSATLWLFTILIFFMTSLKRQASSVIIKSISFSLRSFSISFTATFKTKKKEEKEEPLPNYHFCIFLRN